MRQCPLGWIRENSFRDRAFGVRRIETRRLARPILTSRSRNSWESFQPSAECKFFLQLTQLPLQQCRRQKSEEELAVRCYRKRFACDFQLAFDLLCPGRGSVSLVDCVLFGHVFALLCRAVKTRAFPVVNLRLGVNPHETVAATRCGCGRRCLGCGACCGRRACGGCTA